MATIPTETQVSAGGVAFRDAGQGVEIAIISVGAPPRWQLPKGIIDKGETSESAAIREVREEAGLDTAPAGLIDKVEYWYYSTRDGKRIRYHKFVYFYLLGCLSGSTDDHDHEVNEARWVDIGEAIRMLAFESEKKTAAKAKEMIKSLRPG